MRHGALKPLKQRKSARHLQRRAERQQPNAKIERRTRKAQRQADRLALQTRVAKAMEPERARQEQKRIQKMLRWFTRFPALEDIVMAKGGNLLKTWDNQRGDIDPPEEITVEQEFIPQVNASNPFGDIGGSSSLAANALPPDSDGPGTDLRVDPESDPDE